ncbi:hypothetical protein DXV75_05560 [Alteromonas aestuariivivens]|uniref:GH26 domain-containing protein n=1 Tax=Alteromonas aestuariivivens TaxID=1938339 RepID=A0A3D8MBP2_9ALTE|nr:hypothetical protein [Alteromonas aestuariivivens]RDV27495.1 hypothetical protein DXV75_05560 [Alteromonas aestuariivivens]
MRKYSYQTRVFSTRSCSFFSGLLFFCFSFLSYGQGLYILDGKNGTYRDGNIRDLDFIDGYAWRYSWKDLETGQGRYNFAPLEHIVTKLAAKNQKLSWVMMGDIPTYITSMRRVNTYISGGVLKPSPWDSTVLEQYANFIQAAANYPIADPQQGGRKVALKYHSAFGLIHPTFPGLPDGAIRDNASTKIYQVPGYSRSNLVDYHIDYVLDLVSRQFPGTPLVVSFWPIHDDNRRSPLWSDIQSEVLQFDNVMIWMDNLAASRPCTNCNPVTGYPSSTWAQHMTNTGARARTGFQMLSSWDKTFNSKHVPKVKNATPMDGINYAIDDFDADYFEIYVWDVEKTAWQANLRQLHNQLQ